MMQLNFNALNNLKIQWKLLLIPAVMAIPIAYTIYAYSKDKSGQIEFSAKEQIGMDYLASVRNAHFNMLRYRGLTNAMLRGASAAQGPRTEAMAAVDKDLAATEAIDGREAPGYGRNYGAVLEATSALKGLQQKWSQMKSRNTGNPADVFNENSQMIQTTADFIRLVTDKSNLTLDPDEDSYYLMDLSSFQMPELFDTISQLGGYGGGIVAAKALTAEERAQIGFLQREIEGRLTNFKNAFDKSQNYNPVLRESFAGKIDVELREIRDFNAFASSQLLTPSALSGDGVQFFNRNTQLTDRLRTLEESVTTELDKLLDKRIDKFTGERNFSWMVSLIGLLLAGIVTWLVTRAILGQTEQITGLIVEVEKGNFDKRIPVQSTDELGRTAKAFNSMLDNTKGLMQSRDERDRIQSSIMKLLDEVANVADGDLTAEAEVTEDMTGAIADAFNFMIVNLRELIGKVKDVSYQLNATTTDSAQHSERLAQGSQEQSERITQTSTALTEMSAQIVRVSQSAESSAQVAEQSLSTARKGSEAVQNTVHGMNRIQEQVQETSRRIRQLGERSQEIEEIVRLIEEITDRTGVLALNASIQASAAGEYGHGFGVVANEVEHLATRSAEATKRISSLIRAIQSGTGEAIVAMDEVKREVVNGVVIANSAGASLHEIESVSGQLANLVRSISHATQQQARGSEALSNTMGQLAQLTNQTTTGVMQSALTVRNLASLADDLRSSVSSFKVAENEDSLNASGTLGGAQGSLMAQAAARNNR
ncbi:MAG: HAMP domain-containing protein [Acidobacteria bacterium]|nr:HAMP domain-containing protein [Acidobacteriota bacterium]